MKNGRYSDAQIMAVLKQAEGGVPVSELCRAHGMSSASFYKWRARFGGMHCTAGYRVAMSREWMRR
ncbi:hypothetical protein ROLI_045810 (plasmid) [Roseobacter fucihabitans]|uniref:Transposase n=1 Tax=Roseobacter fucihabitans TaxID=1537242 RepID=A0ABZ2BZE4_9RHOB|nr:Transposase [Roseobacter litoralis]